MVFAKYNGFTSNPKNFLFTLAIHIQKVKYWEKPNNMLSRGVDIELHIGTGMPINAAHNFL